MKRLIAALILTACAAQASDRLTLNVRNQSDHAMVDLSIWQVLPDGTSVDDNLGAIVDPVPAHAETQIDTALARCMDHLRVVVTYDDGFEASQDMNYCETQSITFEH